MNKLFKFLIVFFFAVLIVTPACAYQSKIVINVGDSFKIVLESNPTTGYQWQLAEPFDNTALQKISSVYVSPKSKFCGAPGKEIWVFKGIREGETTIFMNYARPWESVQPALQNVYEIEINSKK